MIFNVPNTITFIRLIILPFFLYEVYAERHFNAFLLFLAGSITDFLDGFFARFLKQKTKFGSFFDAIVDKIFLLSSILLLTYKNLLPYFFAILIFLRDFIIIVWTTYFFLKGHIKELKPHISGKILITLEFLVVLFLISENLFNTTFLAGILNLTILLAACFCVLSLIFYGLEFTKKKGL
jgi:cardiolipin synthase